MDVDYDRLDDMICSHSGLHQLLGIANDTDFGYNRILDNLQLLDENTLKQLNAVIVEFGHNEAFKKKGMEALFVKSVSNVVESNVHFPTDYNLYWYCARTSSDTIEKLAKSCPNLVGWRKVKD